MVCARVTSGDCKMAKCNTTHIKTGGPHNKCISLECSALKYNNGKMQFVTQLLCLHDGWTNSSSAKTNMQNNRLASPHLDWPIKHIWREHVEVQMCHSPPPLCVLRVRPWQADGDGRGRSHVVPLHHLSAHLYLHKGRVHQPCQQPHGRLQRFREETGEGEVVRHVTTAPAVPLVEA